MDWYFRADGVVNLEALTAFELKRFLAEQQERGLSDNTIHGFFQVIKHLRQLVLARGVPGRPEPCSGSGRQRWR